MKNILLTLLLCCFCSIATATDYYVRTDGSDANNGLTDSAGGAWLTIAHAASTVTAGAHVHVGGGTFLESPINVSNSGTSGSPIIFQGTMSGSTHQTIIRGGTLLSDGLGNDWALAGTATGDNWAEGKGVYTMAHGLSGSDVPVVLSIVTGGESYKVHRLCTTLDSGSYCGNWQSHLTQASSATYYPPDFSTGAPDVTVNWWDGFEILYAADETDIWIATRDDADPDSLGAIYANTDGSGFDGVGFGVYGKNYIEIRDFRIENYQYGIYLGKLGGVTPCDNITVNNCKILNGWKRILTSSGTNFTITNNIIDGQPYSDFVDPTYAYGPWIGSDSYIAGVMAHHYYHLKYPTGWADGTRCDTGLYLTGSNHSVNNNTIRNNQGTVILYSDDTNFNNNTCYNSDLGLFMDGASIVTGTNIYDNTFYSADNLLRFGDTDKGGHQVNFYRNKFWNQQGRGRHIFFHHNTVGGTITSWSDLRFYHNSFAGGGQWLSYSSNYTIWSGGGSRSTRDFQFVGNIISSPALINESGGEAALELDTFDYNWYFVDAGALTAEGTGCITEDTNLYWDTATLTDFQKQDAAVVDAGTDVTQAPYSYTGFESNYWTGSAPDMGAVEFTLITDPGNSYPASVSCTIQ